MTTRISSKRWRVLGREYNLGNAVTDAQIAARLHGTSFLVLITGNQNNLLEPLEPETLREGDLLAVHVFDRWDAEVIDWDLDIASKNYGKPYSYKFRPPILPQGDSTNHNRV